MIVGAYWTKRQESREQVAQRIVAFLEAIGRSDARLATWYLKARSKATANVRVMPTTTEVASRLRVNRRDVDRQVIPELGFSIDLWNGGGCSLSIHAGSFSQRTGNSAVLSAQVEPASALNLLFWREVLDASIAAFDPDHAVVTSYSIMTRYAPAPVWQNGWLTYVRGRALRENANP